MANNQFLIWGRDPISGKILKKALEIEEAPNKQEIVSTYCTNTALINITKNGIIFKTGRLSFEKKSKDDSKYKTPVIIPLRHFSTGYLAEKISLGENHILVLTKSKNAFSWGDNYYGQLGLDNYLIPLALEPQKLKNIGITVVKAFKNNSFALDGKLIILIIYYSYLRQKKVMGLGKK